MQQGTPFDLYQLSEYPSLTPLTTDTAQPYMLIPMYFIHSLEAPFCKKLSCKCHWQQQEVRRLLGHVVEGELTLKEAAQLLDDINGERK